MCRKVMILLIISAGGVQALAAGPTDVDPWFLIGNLWILVSTALVLVMHLGFSMIEAGFSQSKNTINILFKNVAIVAIGTLCYALVGFNLMYPGAEFAGGFWGFGGFGLSTDAAGLTSAYNPAYTYWSDFIFQAVFAATAATIVSGAVAERIKLSSFLLFSTVYVAIFYPIVGMWKWGGGFLNTLSTPFHDFAGSTLVHSVGGWAALAGCIVLGPRLGKYVNGQIRPIPPHSLPLATIGCFLLWFGWFGFNGGSVLSADPAKLSLVFVTTCLAASAGIIGSMIASRLTLGNLDLSMALNGTLAGLVGITAGADVMSPMDSVVVGFVAGVLVVIAVTQLDRMKIDDPVGAVSVHLVCGIWGTLAVGLFGSLASTSQLISQTTGIVAVGAFCFTSAMVLFKAMDLIKGIRVSEQEETLGLDLSEHGATAYRGLNFNAELEKHDVQPTPLRKVS